MIEIFRDHPWLVVVLAGIMVPIAGILMGAWSAWIWGRERRAALRAIEAFAASGREPPAELLRAVGGGRGRRHWEGPPQGAMGENGGPGSTSFTISDADREALREEWRGRWKSYRRREPLRTWRRAILFGALAGGFYAGSIYAETADTQRGLMITAIILGALAAATVLSAILATVFRER